MKQRVIEFLKNLPKSKSEQFNMAFELYRQSPGKSMAAERVYNAAGYSDSNLQNLKYDLQKLHGIKDKEIVPAPKVIEVKEESVNTEATDTNTEATDANTEATDANKEASDLTVNTSEEDEEKKELLTQNEELTEENENLKSENEELTDYIEGLTDKLNEKAIGLEVSFREEFPFLKEKDCPNELKILVADKISAWKTYEESHAKIQLISEGKIEGSEEDKAALAKTATEAFNENKAIYDELNAYKETGKILGKHPLFRVLTLQREVEEMTTDELIRYKNASAKYFSDNKTAMEKAVEKKDEERVSVITKRVEERKEKLDFVNKKLGVGTK